MCIFFYIFSLIKAGVLVTMNTVQISEGKENCNQCFLQTAKLHKIAFQSSNVMAVMSNLMCSERIRSNKSLTPFWRKIPSYCREFFAQLRNLQITVQDEYFSYWPLDCCLLKQVYLFLFCVSFGFFRLFVLRFLKKNKSLDGVLRFGVFYTIPVVIFEQSAGEVVKSELSVFFLTNEILDLIIF